MIPPKPAPLPVVRLDLDQIGRVINEALVALNILMFDIPPKHWADLSAQERSVILLAVQYVKANPGARPADYHALLASKMREDGWRRGEYADTLRKIHPMACPFEELPAKYRAKQGLVFAMAEHLLRPAG